MSNWIDVSVPVRNGMVHWPGDPAFHIERALDQKKGDVCTVSQIAMGVHTGTHMDAPLHFIEGGITIDADAARCHRRAGAGDSDLAIAKSIRREELIEQQICRRASAFCSRPRTRDKLWNNDEFDEDFVFIAKDAAEYLAECGVRTVGVDYLSVGGFRQDGVETHQALLGAGIWVIEGLESERRRAGRLRTGLPAAETDGRRRLARARHSEEHRMKAAAVFPEHEIAGRCERFPGAEDRKPDRA